MNAAGHPTRYRPEYREPAGDCCLPGASSLELAELLGVAPRAMDNSIASLGGSAPGNTTYGVFLFSRTFIPVRKNYLTRRADALRVLQVQRGRSRLVVHGIRGQRTGSSRRLRDCRTGRHFPTDPMTATLAERPFFEVLLQGNRFRGDRGGVAPQAVVDHDALPPSPVLGYSNTRLLSQFLSLPETVRIFPVSLLGSTPTASALSYERKVRKAPAPRTKYRSAVRQLRKPGGCRG
jgi:hypothetical protein